MGKVLGFFLIVLGGVLVVLALLLVEGALGAGYDPDMDVVRITFCLLLTALATVLIGTGIVMMRNNRRL